MAEPVSGQPGQAAPTAQATTAAAPPAAQGQSATPTQTTASGPVAGEVESFFDPKSIADKPELMSAYKQMQSKWTKELSKFKEGGKKIEAYDSFIANPMGAIQQLAQQYGYSLVQKNPNSAPEDDTPKTWDDVYKRAKQEVLNELKPALGEIRQLKQQNVEQYLDHNYPDWRTYESEMLDTLKSHPTLSHDPDKLYRLSVPEEVFESRAAKAALSKLKAQGDSAQISGANSAPKPTPTEGPPRGASFNDYVAYARQKLASEGLRPVGG
jgi:hypothetical protein